MILCPNCQHREITGALFCEECGVQLVEIEGDAPTASIKPVVTDAFGSPLDKSSGSLPGRFPAVTDSYLTLHIVETEDLISLPPRDEITLGRISAGQPIIPDVDLTPYHAYEEGVSRLHVSIRIQDNQVMVFDLGSANGTRLNGKRIEAHSPYLLHHKDVLTLGRLKVQIYIRT